MVTGWSNDGMKVVYLVAKCYPDLDQLWETEGAIQVLLIYLELQTANSPRRIAVCI
jgi:hypothetical protein